MNEHEVGRRLRDAFGAATIPPDLEARASGRLLAESPRRAGPRAGAALLAAALAVAVVAGLLGTRLTAIDRHRVAAPATSSLRSPAPSPSPVPGLVPPPKALLEAAHLTVAASLVTPFDLASTSNGVTVRLIGAYADTAHTVALLDVPTGYTFVDGTMFDSTGFVNYGSGSSPGPKGFAYFDLNGAATPDADGLAHIRFTVTRLMAPFDNGPTGGPPPGSPQQWYSSAPISGKWEFMFAIPVRPAVALAGSGSTLDLGGVPVTVEKLEVTPSVIHVQVLVQAQGQAILNAGSAGFVRLIDAGTPILSGGGVTVPKQQLTPASADVIRFNYAWARSPAGGDYVLRLQYQQSAIELRGITVPAT